MLVAAGALYLAMGEPTDALMLLGFVLVVMTITILQERRTERALEALRDLSSPRALVIRSGVQRRIPGREVVPGDFLILVEGDRVSADALLRAGIHLSVDESLLTGESVPVRKKVLGEGRTLDPPGGDDRPSLFSGTLVTAGQGVAEVLATGGRTGSGRSGRPSSGSSRSRPSSRRKPAGWFASSRSSASPPASWSSSPTPSREGAGPWRGRRGCSPASRWRWRFFPRNSPSC